LNASSFTAVHSNTGRRSQGDANSRRCGSGEEQIAAYRFIHAADVHLDSPLRSLALRDPALADLIGNATRRTFERIVDLCLDERVDALILAGDLYDGDQTSMKTARFLAEHLRRLHEADIRVFVIRGNHDSLSRITKELIFPDSVKVFGGRAEAITIDRPAGVFPVVIHGLSFSDPHAPDSLVGKYKAPVEGAANIGILHTSLAGAPGHDLYAPCSLSDLEATGFAYWALGHIHKRSVVQGTCTIVMPGMPQGRDINEAGAKSVSLITVGDDRSVQIEERFTSVAQFERVTVDVAEIGEWAGLVCRIGETLERARAGLVSQHLVARIRLVGTTPLAWRIRRDPDLLKTEADDWASRAEACWVEKLEIECRAPGAAQDSSESPIAELGRLIDEEVLNSDAYRNELCSIAEELRSQLPPECRNALGSGDAAFQAAVAKLAKDGSQDVLASLQASPETEER
jgi:DNA repair protein SbcD/Mre11